MKSLVVSVSRSGGTFLKTSFKMWTSLVILKQSHDSPPIYFASQKESQIFPPTTGGAEAMCQDLKIPLLGKVPLDPHIGG